MKSNRRFSGLALVAAVGLTTALAAHGQDVLHARVSFDAGSTLVMGGDAAEWANATINTLVFSGDTLWVDRQGTAEIEFSGGSYLRMADGSKAEVTSLPPSAAVRVWTGSVYVHRMNRSSGDFVVTTPACTVQVDKNTNARVDVSADGATVVSVRWGRAYVRAGSEPPVIPVEAQRVYVDPGMLPSEPVPFDRSLEDAFDTWNRERSELLVNGWNQVPSGVTVEPATLGVSELASSGEWVYVEDRPYWRPTVVVDYVPYRYGCWSYVPAYGHVWVGHYDFSYITSHYGRWSYFPTYGWCWGYDPIWSPAWVATVRYGPYFVWSPIDFYNRPVFWGSANYFNCGGLNWNFYACSFAPWDQIYWGPGHIMPLFGSNITTIYADDVHIWNIYTGNYPHRDRYRIPYSDSRLTVRDYNPSRSIRGPQVYGPSGRSASDRVRTLEAGVGRDRFNTGEAPGVRTVRTASTSGGRSANVRTITQIERPSRDALLRTETGRAGTPGTVARTDVDTDPGRARVRTERPDATPASPRTPGERTAPSIRTESPDAPSGRTAPPVSRPDTGASPRTPGERTAPSIRTESPDAPSGRTAPPVSRPDTGVSPRTPGERTAPTIRTQPPSAPSVGRTAPSGPSRPSAPTIRTVPSSSGPSISRTSPRPSASDNAPSRVITVRPSPTTRTAPSPAPEPRSTPEPSRSSAPPSRSYTAPAPSRSYTAPAPSRSYTAPAPSRSYTAPAPSRSFSAPEPPRSFSAPEPPRSFSAPAPSRSFSAPSRSESPRSFSAPGSSGSSRSFSAPAGRSSEGGRGGRGR